MRTVKTLFVVPRPSNDESTVAIVETTISSRKLCDSHLFFVALRRAITNWVKETKKGKEEWVRSCNDFNIGDLSSLIPCPSLEKYMKKEGILTLSIDIHSADYCSWCYDDLLVNEDELEGDMI